MYNKTVAMLLNLDKIAIVVAIHTATRVYSHAVAIRTACWRTKIV